MESNDMFLKIKSIQKTRGASLIEMLISVAISGLVVVCLGAVSLYAGRTFVATTNYNELNSTSRNALDTLTRDIRQSFAVLSFTGNTLTLLDGNSQPLVYSYSPTLRTLSRMSQSDGSNKILLTECDNLTFELFQRNTKPGTYDQYEASTGNWDSTCKLVQVSWVCSRTMMHYKIHTEIVQTAKIVIRS
jgi:hypothetical protein